MEFIVKLPQWKAYLYTLIQRIRIYKLLNANWINLHFSREDIFLLRRSFNKYVSKGVIRKPKTYRYEELVRSILVDNLGIATKEEIELAMRLSWVKHINTGDLIMEIKQLKEFGKEVGLKPLQMGKMAEDEIIIKIINSVEPNNEYSQEFIAWYDDLNDEYFDAAETEDITPEKTEVPEVDENIDVDELKEAINDITKIGELKEVCKDNDYGVFFESINLKNYRTAKKLKVAMLAAIEEYKTNKGEEKEEEDPSAVIDDETREELIEIIQGIETEDDLIEFVSDEDIEELFKDALDISNDTIDIDALKLQMFSHLGYEEPKPEPEETKPMSLKERMAAKKAKKETSKEKTVKEKEPQVIEFDFDDFDADEVYAAAEKLGFPQLKKFAKQLGIVAKPGTKKVEALDMVANKLQELAEGADSVGESTEDAEVTVNRSMVEDAIKAVDTETLIAMCEQLEIKLNMLQKKSAKIMGSKLLEVVPEDEPEKRDISKVKLNKKLKDKDKKAPAEETKSIYQLIEEMVLEGETEAAIVKAIKPHYTEKGKALLYIKKRAKQMIEIITKDNE